ncbi:hypothetical protein ACB276_19670 [Enterobacter hormaechei subsp. xiangfangensis]
MFLTMLKKMNGNINIFPLINMSIILCFGVISGVVCNVNAADNDSMTINVNGAVTRECSVSISQPLYDMGVISASELNGGKEGDVFAQKVVPIDVNCRGNYKLKFSSASATSLPDDGSVACLAPGDKNTFYSPVMLCALTPDNKPLGFQTTIGVWQDSTSGTKDFTFMLKKYTSINSDKLRSGIFDIVLNLTIEPI